MVGALSIAGLSAARAASDDRNQSAVRLIADVQAFLRRVLRPLRRGNENYQCSFE
jgi:hypothetical protein